MTLETRPPTVRGSTFGNYVQFDLPAGTDAIIVSVNKYQRVPRKLLLPGQLYTRRIAELMAEPGVTGVEVIPIRSADWISVEHLADAAERES